MGCGDWGHIQEWNLGVPKAAPDSRSHDPQVGRCGLGVSGLCTKGWCKGMTSPSVTPRSAPSVSLASLSPLSAGRLLWLRATAGPAELKIAV